MKLFEESVLRYCIAHMTIWHACSVHVLNQKWNAADHIHQHHTDHIHQHHTDHIHQHHTDHIHQLKYISHEMAALTHSFFGDAGLINCAIKMNVKYQFNQFA